MAKYTQAVRDEMLRLETIRQAWHAKVGHVCPRYETARSYGPHWEGMADPALQEGIGCTQCHPPDGRVRIERNDATLATWQKRARAEARRITEAQIVNLAISFAAHHPNGGSTRDSSAELIRAVRRLAELNEDN